MTRTTNTTSTSRNQQLHHQRRNQIDARPRNGRASTRPSGSRMALQHARKAVGAAVQQTATPLASAVAPFSSSPYLRAPRTLPGSITSRPRSRGSRTACLGSNHNHRQLHHLYVGPSHNRRHRRQRSRRSGRPLTARIRRRLQARPRRRRRRRLLRRGRHRRHHCPRLRKARRLHQLLHHRSIR